MLVNLTPHDVTVYDGDQIVMTVRPSGTVARLAETATPDGVVAGVPGTVVTLGAIEGLPAPDGETTYVVSMPLLMGALASGVDRADLVYPYGQVRDGQGRIIGCRSLARLTA
jgi:hypothetical protein